MDKPTIGRIVIYRTDGRNGLVYDLPAIVNCTRDTYPGDYPSGEKNPLPVPESDMHVHLTVFTPGGFGTHVLPKGQKKGHVARDATEFKNATRMWPGSGTYVEWNVPPDDSRGNALPHSWRWPVRG